MLACDTHESWVQFLEYVKKHCSPTAYGNWLAPIKVIEATAEEVVLEVPNIFVEEYILANYKEDLCSFLPVRANGDPAVRFVIAPTQPQTEAKLFSPPPKENPPQAPQVKLNENYRFETFIEGPQNQFVKSAAMGVASRPGQSYNPLFIHGGVGLGKTHILHSIGHYVQKNHRKLRVQYITTEGFINTLVTSLREKSIERMKRSFRDELEVLLVDDIQFLENRSNFEEEFCNTFETLINQKKQIVITSDKPPSQLKLSERMIARMEWGLVAHVAMPDLETSVAILLHKAEQRGLEIPKDVAFFIAESFSNNVRQLEGAINRLGAHCRLLNVPITEQFVQQTLRDMLPCAPMQKINVVQVLRAVAVVFQIRVNELTGNSKVKKVSLARQVAMFLAKEFVKEPVTAIASAFGKTHSTILHACNCIEKRTASEDEALFRQIDMVRSSLKNME